LETDVEIMTHTKQKKITRERLARLAFCNSKELPELISVQGRRKRWVGIGWVDEGPATGYEHALVIDNDTPRRVSR
jgi:hypothetical protein